MCVQTDLRVEAVHLRRFYNNFASVRSSVTPPLPVPGMDTEAVLVETFEAGQLLYISSFGAVLKHYVNVLSLTYNSVLKILLFSKDACQEPLLLLLWPLPLGLCHLHLRRSLLL